MLGTPPRINLASLLMTAAAAMCLTCGQHFDCPLPQHLSPCTCLERPLGLDVVCTDVTSIQLREVLDVVSITRQTLWFLRISKTDLSSFPKNLLEGLDIRNLILVQSNISKIDNGVFADGIESLDLARNCLNRVPSLALSSLKSLAALNLDFNAIETLEAHVFGDLVSLLWLSLYGNRIRLIDSRAFLGTEASLTRLNLGGNRLGQVPRYALQRLNCLQGLRLHDNNLTEVLVENLPESLCDLDLSGNDLTHLDAEAFVTLKHLSALDIEDNRIKSIHEDAFNGIHDSLEWLKLGGNQLAAVPYQALRNLSRLRQLDLRGNLIRKLDSHSFETFGKTLKFIFLQKNCIREIEEGTLDVLESVEWLYLHSNALSELRYETFKSVIDNLHVLDLHDNPYHCDCSILWFRDWLQARGQNVANLPRETRCNSTKELAQRPIVKLSNSSFVCSSSSSNPSVVHPFLLVLLFTTLVFCMCR